MVDSKTIEDIINEISGEIECKTQQTRQLEMNALCLQRRLKTLLDESQNLYNNATVSPSCNLDESFKVLQQKVAELEEENSALKTHLQKMSEKCYANSDLDAENASLKEALKSVEQKLRLSLRLEEENSKLKKQLQRTEEKYADMSVATKNSGGFGCNYGELKEYLSKAQSIVKQMCSTTQDTDNKEDKHVILNKMLDSPSPCLMCCMESLSTAKL